MKASEWVEVPSPTNRTLCYLRKIPGGWLHMTCLADYTPIATVFIPEVSK